MRIQTILNQIEKFMSFVYGEAALERQSDGWVLVRPKEQPGLLLTLRSSWAGA